MREAFVLEAALRSLSAGLDMLAQLINVSLLKAQIQPESSNFTKEVLAALKASPNEYGQLLARIEELWASPECKYVEAFTNTSKHRTIIRTKQSFKVTPGEGYQEGAEFAEFTYMGKKYPAKHRPELLRDMESFQARVEAIWDEIGRILEERMKATKTGSP
jgi:hypothetical protein